MKTFLLHFYPHHSPFLQKTSVTKKQSVVAVEEEQASFAGMKLKKSQRVQKEITEETLPTVDLKHHEFEKAPQLEEVH